MQQCQLVLSSIKQCVGIKQCISFYPVDKSSVQLAALETSVKHCKAMCCTKSSLFQCKAVYITIHYYCALCSVWSVKYFVGSVEQCVECEVMFGVWSSVLSVEHPDAQGCGRITRSLVAFKPKLKILFLNHPIRTMSRKFQIC